MQDSLGTAERILQASLELMQDKGFKSVTIKDIALASDVSEMTVFRHFKTKLGVLEAAVNKYSYVPVFEKLFEEQVVDDVEIDLTFIAQAYLNSMEKNKAIYLLAVQERTTMPELMNMIVKNTKKLRQLLTNYFRKMQTKKKVVEGDPEKQAMAFLTMCHGYFSSTALWGTTFTKESPDEFIKIGILSFCRGVLNQEIR